MVPLAIPKPFLSHLHSTMFLLILMTRLGCPSELDWINDEGAWDDVLKDKNIFYKVPDSDDHFAISFEIESEYNSEEESADCTLVNIVNIEVQ